MKKYKLIIVLIVSIVVFNVIVALSSYQMSKRVNRFNAYATALVQQQAVLDKMSKDIIDVNIFSERFNSGREGLNEEGFVEKTYYQVHDIGDFYRQLSHHIALFAQGGRLQVTGGGDVEVPAPTGEIAELNQHIDEIWQPLSTMIAGMLVQFEQQRLSELDDSIRFTADYVRKYSEILGQYFDVLHDHYLQQAESYSAWLRLLQVLAITFTLLFFGLLTLWGLRSLILSDRQIEQARQETANIMNTVKEGLFLIDRDLVIGSQYSAKLEEIIGQYRIAGQTLSEVFFSIVSKRDFQTTQDFIEQLFNEDVIESLIHELNPLERVKAYIAVKSGLSELRYLSFGFSRVYDEAGQITNVLVSVVDITRQVNLEDRLEKERTQHDEQVELLSSIISVPLASLQGFIQNVNRACHDINEILRASRLEKGELMTKASLILREIHGIKGEASALGLQPFIAITEEIETRAEKLRDKHNLTGRDFLPLTMELDRTMDLVSKVTQLYNQISGEPLKLERNAAEPVGLPDPIAKKESRADADVTQFSRLVRGVAARNDKNVRLLVKGWSNTEILDTNQQNRLREIITQLLRNAVVHGIETGAERLAKGKAEQGRIQCQAERDEQYLTVLLSDDGRGIDFAALKEQALAKGILSGHETGAVLRNKLMNYLFNSGVSTAGSITEDAGRGVGLDVVKGHIQALGAKVALNSKEGISTTFKIRLPIKNAAKNGE